LSNYGNKQAPRAPTCLMGQITCDKWTEMPGRQTRGTILPSCEPADDLYQTNRRVLDCGDNRTSVSRMWPRDLSTATKVDRAPYALDTRVAIRKPTRLIVYLVCFATAANTS
jgi:hypothetical protein